MIHLAIPDIELPVVIYEGAIYGIFGKTNGDRIIEQYKNQTPAHGDCRDVFSAILTDYWFECASQKFALAMTSGSQNAFVYHFKHVFSSSFIFPEFGLPKVCVNRTCHASELPFVFHASTNPAVQALNATFTPAEVVLSGQFSSYWTCFVMTGDPNKCNHDLPIWPAWNLITRENLELVTPSPVGNNTLSMCSFWDTVGYVHVM